MSNPPCDLAGMKMIMPATIEFQEVRIGQHFEFRGCRYQKLAVNLGRDEDHYGNLFQPQTEVLPDPFGPPTQTEEPGQGGHRAADRWAEAGVGQAG